MLVSSFFLSFKRKTKCNQRRAGTSSSSYSQISYPPRVPVLPFRLIFSQKKDGCARQGQKNRMSQMTGKTGSQLPFSFYPVPSLSLSSSGHVPADSSGDESHSETTIKASYRQRRPTRHKSPHTTQAQPNQISRQFPVIVCPLKKK